MTEVTGLSQSKGDNVFIKYTDGFRAKNPVDGLYAFDMPLVCNTFLSLLQKILLTAFS
jgi:hypothetical protein